mmetsp:Transcript_13897/g.25103  ORF Transcript_13897/g.25103 Transcript_13897/m.25103 type:complete len:455 (-) Transcript_13897:68-1432(-)
MAESTSALTARMSLAGVRDPDTKSSSSSTCRQHKINKPARSDIESLPLPLQREMMLLIIKGGTKSEYNDFANVGELRKVKDYMNVRVKWDRYKSTKQETIAIQKCFFPYNVVGMISYGIFCLTSKRVSPGWKTIMSLPALSAFDKFVTKPQEKRAIQNLMMMTDSRLAFDCREFLREIKPEHPVLMRYGQKYGGEHIDEEFSIAAQQEEFERQKQIEQSKEQLSPQMHESYNNVVRIVSSAKERKPKETSETVAEGDSNSDTQDAILLEVNDALPPLQPFEVMTPVEPLEPLEPLTPYEPLPQVTPADSDTTTTTSKKNNKKRAKETSTIGYYARLREVSEPPLSEDGEDGEASSSSSSSASHNASSYYAIQRAKQNGNNPNNEPELVRVERRRKVVEPVVVKEANKQETAKTSSVESKLFERAAEELRQLSPYERRKLLIDRYIAGKERKGEF